MGVVETLEVINVTHRQHIVAPQTLHALVEGSPPRQASQFVAERHLIGFMSHTGSDHQHDLAAHDVKGEWQNEGLRQHPEQAQQPYQLRGVQRARLIPVLCGQGKETNQEHRVRELDQAHPGAMQQWPADLRQPV